MSLLYKEKKDIVYQFDMEKIPFGYKFTLSCDGGKYGTDEICNEFCISHDKLLEFLCKENEYEN